MAYEGKIFWMDGKLHIQKKEQLIEYLKQFPDETWLDIKVTPIGVINNTSQSKLYWTWCDIIHMEYGWDSAGEIHKYFKKTFNDGNSTRGFDSKQWSQYMTKVLSWASENQINLPTGNSE